VSELRQESRRAAALAIVVALSIGHVWSYYKRTHDAQYREAVVAASTSLKPNEVMTVVPAYAVEVLRYYLPPDRVDCAVRPDDHSFAPSVLILAERNLAQEVAQSYRKEYPRVVARFRGVTVLGRSAGTSGEGR
jgi:hypothetical protein